VRIHRYFGLSLPKMPSGANTFEISDIQEGRNREAVLTHRPESNSNVTLRRQLATVSIRQRHPACAFPLLAHRFPISLQLFPDGFPILCCRFQHHFPARPGKLLTKRRASPAVCSMTSGAVP
jgi:hypothetical protein